MLGLLNYAKNYASTIDKSLALRLLPQYILILPSLHNRTRSKVMKHGCVGQRGPEYGFN